MAGQVRRRQTCQRIGFERTGYGGQVQRRQTC
jgi:hypothetical protein